MPHYIGHDDFFIYRCSILHHILIDLFSYDSMSRYARLNLLNQSLKNSTRSAFSEIYSTIGNHILHSLSPAYRSSQLIYPRPSLARGKRECSGSC